MAASWSVVANDLQSPHGLAFDDEDTLFVAEAGQGRIRRLRDGHMQTFADTGGRPLGIAFDDSGDLFVAESARHHLLLISLDEAAEVYANQCRGERFVCPQELCFSAEGGSLFTDGGRDGADGSVYHADLDGEVKRIATGLAAPSGMVWSQDASTLYVSETGTGQIVTLELDEAGESMVNQQTFVSFDEGVPGALVFDALGHLYVALQGVGIVIVDDAGQITQTLEIGEGQPKSLAFGGIDYNELFVSEAGSGSVLSCQREVSGQRPFAGPRSV